jgi:hypothetical protein
MLYQYKREPLSNDEVNPVRNSSGALNPAGIILKCNPAAEQRGIISNGVNWFTNACETFDLVTTTKIYLNHI